VLNILYENNREDLDTDVGNMDASHSFSLLLNYIPEIWPITTRVGILSDYSFN
jgi:hypothetical protein